MPISVGLDPNNNIGHYNSEAPEKPSESFLGESIRGSMNIDNIINSTKN